MFSKKYIIRNLLILFLMLNILGPIIAKIIGFDTPNSLYAAICIPIVLLPLYAAGVIYCKDNQSRKPIACRTIKILITLGIFIYVTCLIVELLTN